MSFFKELRPEEEISFRQWARDNYKPMSEISGCWALQIQDECVQINKEYDAKVVLPTIEEIFGV